MPPYQRQQPTQITRNLNLIDAKPHADEFLCQMQPQIRDAATTLMRRGAAKGRPAPPARFRPGRSCRWRSYSSKSASILLNIDQNRGAVNPVRYLPHLSWCARTLRLSSLPSVAQRLERLSVQRLKSPLEGFSPGVHLRGRCYGDRTGGRPARSVLSGAVATACLSGYLSGSLDRTVQRGRCHGDRVGGRPARSVLSGAVSTACLSSYPGSSRRRSREI